MKYLKLILLVLAFSTLVSCDLRSETAKNDMKKYESSPTPPIIAAPTSTPIDPKDSVTVDTSQDGDQLSVNGYELTKTTACTKFNSVKINGDDHLVTIKGACKQVMINGDRNKVTADASVEFVLNGTENVINYTKFANGKAPIVTENQPGNTIEKMSAETMTNTNTAK